MVLPIVAYGNSVLKKKAREITSEYPSLLVLLNNMWDTMYNGRGVGLAAPQIGLDICIFIVDSLQLEKENETIEDQDEKYKLVSGVKKVFINPTIIDETGTPWNYEEGCLSIPEIRVKVSRKETIKISYFDENFIKHTDSYDGMNARIIQHEYDHLEGILLTDYMTPLKKSLIKGKLDNISKGRIQVKYKMKFLSGR